GKFYVWQPAQIKNILGPKRGAQFCDFYDVTASGNFHEPHGPKNHSILQVQIPIQAYAKKNNLNLKSLTQELQQDRKRLLEVRSKRGRPSLDDKILTDWNGLMIAALSKAGRALNKPAYTHAASQAADFLLKTLKDKDGRLLHRYRDGDAGIIAHLDDYAFLVWGLIDLYESTFETKYLNEAIKLNDKMVELFWDKDHGGLYFTASDAEKLIIRPKEIYDGAYPSGNSVAALNFLRLSKMTGRTHGVQKADQIMKAFSSQVTRAPSAHAQLMIALDFAVNQSQEIVVAGDLEKSETQKMLWEINKRFLPNTVVVHHPLDQIKAKKIRSLCSYIEKQVSINGQATAYVCENFSCQAPTTVIEKLIQSISKSKK
ncbi:MAG: thioredoxin domain-containing protein, partial [Phycisphaeraceae bacterium]|nr:thioredoxin domain-containing protein [Phycisphaeraceae bacterium]